MASAPKLATLALLALTLLVRGGMLIANAQALRADPDLYRQLAENVVEHRTLGSGDRPTAFRPPLYLLLVAGCVAMGPWSNVATALLHLAFGVLTVWLVFRMGQRWGLGRYAFLAAGLVACDPILLAQSTVVMTETLATLLAVLAVTALSWAHQRESVGRSIVAGACLGLAVLCRPAFLPWAVLAMLLASLVAVHRARVFLAMFLQATLVVAPWVMRNQVHFGRPIITTTHGGYTLLLGNNPQFYEHLRSGKWGEVWDAEELHRARQSRAAAAAPRGELDADRLAYQEAWENIGQQPGMFACSCMLRVGRLWSLLPQQTAAEESSARRWSRYAVGLWYLVELSLAVLGTWLLMRCRTARPVPPGEGWGEGTWWLLLAACFTAVHTLYWTDMRMRAPLMPGVALAAAAAAAWIAAGVCKRKAST